MKPLLVAFTLALMSLPASAQEWRLLEEGEVTSTLVTKTLIYDGASQVFYDDGKTLYFAGRPSEGEWRETNGQYCSLWPPNPVWSCFDLEISGDQSAVRFIDAFGNITEGSFFSPN